VEPAPFTAEVLEEEAQAGFNNAVLQGNRSQAQDQNPRYTSSSVELKCIKAI